MDCSCCKAQVVEEARFCSHCGTRLAGNGGRHLAQEATSVAWHERLARLVADGVPGMVAYWTSELRCLFANRAYLEWFGRDPKEVIGLRIDELLGANLFRANESYIRGALNGIPQRFERTLTKADGTIGHTWAQYVPDVNDGRVHGFFVLVSDITELKKTQEALRASETEARKLAVVASRTHNAVTLTDAAGRIEWLNEGFVRMTGYTLDEVRGRNFGSFLKGPATDPNVSAALWEALADGREFNGELINYDKSGRLYWVRIEAQPIFGDDGTLTHFMTIESDVTAQKQAEELLRLNESRLRLALEVAGMLSWDWTVGTNEVFYSQDYGAYFGLAATGPVVPNDETSLQTVHPDDRRPLQAAFEDALKGKCEFQFEFRGPPCGGEPTWYVTRGQFVRDVGDRSRRMIGITQDVTLQKRAEESLRRSHEDLERQVLVRTTNLKRSESQYRELVESTADAIFVKQSGRITFANSAFLRMIGAASLNDVLGRNPFDFIHPDSHRVVREHLRQLREAGRSMPYVEAKYVRSDAATIPVEIMGAAFDDCGTVAIQVIARDLSERKRAEVQVTTLRDELAHATRLGTMGELASGLAHELNQPLAALRLYASEAIELSGSFELQSLRECLLRIDDQANRAGEIIRSMRALISRRPLEREPADINGLLGEVLALLDNDLRTHRIIMELDLAENLPEISVEKIQIQQVLINLICNAVESMIQPDDAPRRMSITTSLDTRSIRVRIADSGSGICPTIAAKLFEPFQSTKPKGLGLGLTICRNLIDAHGGSIGAEPVSARGTTFYFTLPLPECEGSLFR